MPIDTSGGYKSRLDDSDLLSPEAIYARQTFLVLKKKQKSQCTFIPGKNV